VITNSQKTASGLANGGFIYLVTATNHPTSYSATGLPTPLTVDRLGLILGIPKVAGTYVAKITASNAYGTSAPFTLTITINPEYPPKVAVTAPAAGTVAVAPANLTLAAAASSADAPPVPIRSVTFYAGTTKVGTALLPPYTFAWKQVPAGTYAVTAVATDLLGVSATSSAVTVTVNP
jgi:hypothetical protein